MHATTLLDSKPSKPEREPWADLLGDPETWVEAYGTTLLRVATTRVADLSTAEDLVQETLLSAWRNRATFDGSCAAETWLIAILRRRTADYYRGRSRSHDANPQSEGLQNEPAAREERPDITSMEVAEFWSLVQRCTSDMPTHLARAFRLRTYQEQAPESICKSEGISRSNLSVRLHRARQLLRQCLELRWFEGEGRLRKSANDRQ